MEVYANNPAAYGFTVSKQSEDRTSLRVFLFPFTFSLFTFLLEKELHMTGRAYSTSLINSNERDCLTPPFFRYT
jgi:hypothetical protein